MSLTPLINAPLLIQVHVAFALIALLTGPIAIHRQTRDRLHKSVGYVWVVAMVSVAGSALFIPAHAFAIIGHFGPIHLFSVLVFHSIWTGMRAIYRRDMTAHKAALQGLYWQGILLAGLFNFLPGRMVNRMIFAETPQVGYTVIALGGLGLSYVFLRQSKELRASVNV